MRCDIRTRSMSSAALGALMALEYPISIRAFMTFVITRSSPYRANVRWSIIAIRFAMERRTLSCLSSLAKSASTCFNLLPQTGHSVPTLLGGSACPQLQYAIWYITSPDATSCSLIPLKRCMSVVLPAPLRPMIPMTSPSSIERLISFSIAFPPKSIVRLLISIKTGMHQSPIV